MLIRLGEHPLDTLVGMLLMDHPMGWVVGTPADPADSDRLAGMILNPQEGITDVMLEDIADHIADAYFARPRWQARRLWEKAFGLWPELDGELYGNGVDILSAPADRATNMVYRFLVHRMRHDKSASESFFEEMSRPPVGVAARAAQRPKSKDAAAADWNATAALVAQAQG
ncbi:hypothetical protein GCM10007304_17580 [Rhodococcoides trifolii]|uniref:Uncharacterized protein n=1 Tax=Rhodococcoides trifolii TaxID=908250 RepID=A0A917CZD3_9NOCA|nr:hypothetical protein GCM10007304_17580 [Rhodococcus trifolii]